MGRKLGPDIRDVKPTRIIMSIDLSIDGGAIGLSRELDAVWGKTVKAFEEAAHAEGLAFAWTANVRCVEPKTMDARVAKQDLCIVKPPSDPARLTQPAEEATPSGSATECISSSPPSPKEGP